MHAQLSNNFAMTILLVTAILTLVSCQPEQPAVSGAWGGPIKSKVIFPLAEKVIEWDEFTGRFRASKRVEIRARVSGYLSAVKFKDGQVVNQGDVLFIVDQRPYQIALEIAQAQFEIAKKDFQRAENLRKTKAMSQEEFDKSFQEMRIAKASLSQAELELEFTEVKAPFSGRISRNYIDEGNWVSGGSASADVLTTILALQPIEFYFEGSEADVLKYIRLTQSGKRVSERGAPWPVFVKLQDEKDFVHKGVINFVDNELDADTGTMQVRALFENQSGILEPGLFGRLRMSTTEEFDALLVPDTAIGTEQTRKYVYVVGPENKATRKYLNLGTLHTPQLRIVKSGLSEKDRIIVGNLQMIQPGAVVEPIEAAEHAPNAGE